jgi:predicted DNA-binding transcriptional regulator AlpA
MDDNLIPLKRVAAQLGVSRATLWRVSQSRDFPSSVKVRGRVYWRMRDLAAMETALDAFQGRSAFERDQRQTKAREAVMKAMAAIKKSKRRSTTPSPLKQLDLFGGAGAPAPGGAERIK